MAEVMTLMFHLVVHRKQNLESDNVGVVLFGSNTVHLNVSCSAEGYGLRAQYVCCQTVTRAPPLAGF